MFNATSAPAGGVVLDWRHATIGPLAPCILCGLPALCRSPVKDSPCHKRCAETWITRHATSHAHLAHLIAVYSARSPKRGRVMATPASDRFRVIYHPLICPDCGSGDITSDEVDTGDGLTETALTCRACGTAWPTACVSEWGGPQ